MQSAFSGIEMGKRSLFAHERALMTTGQNLSNANTEGYSRQRVQLGTTEPLYRADLERQETPGQIGQGVDVESITRVKDMLLEERIVANGSDEAYWQARDKYIKQMEQIYNEPSDVSLRSRMDKFWESWQDLSQNPEQLAARQAVIERGKSLTDGVQLRFEQLDQVRAVLNKEVETGVSKVNDLTSRISELNIDIVKSQAEGDSPNDLLDRRDQLINELSTYVNVTIDQRNPKEYSVWSGGVHLIQGGNARKIDTRTDPNNDGLLSLFWADTKGEASFASGSIAAHLELRDKDLRQEVQGLDSMTVNFMNLVNEVHKKSYGTNGSTGIDFFVERPAVLNAQGNYDRNGDGKLDSTYVFRMNGKNALEPTQQIGLAGSITLPAGKSTVDVPYYAADTVQDLVIRINHAGADVAARLDREGHLSLKATVNSDKNNPDFVIRSLSDSGQFLVGYAGLLRQSGPQGAYSWNQVDAVQKLAAGADFGVAPVAHPSAWISLNEEIVRDPQSIATSLGTPTKPGDIGDGRAALEIADLRQKTVNVGNSASFDDYFADRVAAIGLKGQEAQIATKTQELIMKNLKDLRQSYSGVNLDEELAEMMKFQHGYNAAARFVNQVDQMLDTIINRMGV